MNVLLQLCIGIFKLLNSDLLCLVVFWRTLTAKARELSSQVFSYASGDVHI